jgi:hypothetical protein
MRRIRGRLRVKGDSRMTKKEDAERYRFKQGEKLLALFEEYHGYPARTGEELGDWLVSAQGKRATAYDTDSDGNIIPDLPSVDR